MKRKMTKWAAAALLVSGIAAGASDYQVMFETMTCDGETGYGTVQLQDIYKIESADCFDPNTGKKLKKLLVRDMSGHFLIYTLTDESAKKLMKEGQDYMHARKKSLENSDSLYIHHDGRDGHHR